MRLPEAIGHEMYQWCSELFPLHRSLTGAGNRQTLSFLSSKSDLPMKIREIPSGTPAFDWTIPDEWELLEAYIETLDGRRVINVSNSNLHVLGYSVSVDQIISKRDLAKHVHTLPDRPTWIPYATSYYKRTWGFCLSHEQWLNMNEETYHVVINSRHFNGSMTTGEVFIPGESSREILFSTYICHPSMANNELSGPVVCLALVNEIAKLGVPKFSYRIRFAPETIGTIHFISENQDTLRKNLVAGWVVTCCGDEDSYSFIPTRNGKTLTDDISRLALKSSGGTSIEYSFLDRGSDERQYNWPGLDLPVASILRSKHGQYPEYHTSADDLDFISPGGLRGSLEVLYNCFRLLEHFGTYRVTTVCEPKMDNYDLYPTISSLSSRDSVRNRMNYLTYCDGERNSIQIALITGMDVDTLLEVEAELLAAELIRLVD